MSIVAYQEGRLKTRSEFTPPEGMSWGRFALKISAGKSMSEAFTFRSSQAGSLWYYAQLAVDGTAARALVSDTSRTLVRPRLAFSTPPNLTLAGKCSDVMRVITVDGNGNAVPVLETPDQYITATLSGSPADIFMDPLFYVSFNNSTLWYGIRAGVGIIDLRARNVENLDQIERTSVDLYATTRSLYRQHRNSEIRNGAPDTENLPNL